MTTRRALLILLPVMLIFGSGVYVLLGHLKVVRQPSSPTHVHPAYQLPGSLYVAQEGTLYRLQSGKFVAISSAGNWMQPALTPDGKNLVAVRRDAQSSDLFLLNLSGKIIRQLTNDSAAILDANHWAYYPRLDAQGSTLFYSFDSPKAGYRVDLAIWSMALNGGSRQRLTRPNSYTGGDVNPVPLSNGGLLYVKYSVGAAPHSQIWLQSAGGGEGRGLTSVNDDCSEPALSPDDAHLLMVCSGGQNSKLMLADFDGSALSNVRILLQGSLFAVPTWRPDGKGFVFYAPANPNGHFQLWWLPLNPARPPATDTAASPSPSATLVAGKLVQVTEGLDLDATSAPAWTS
jgi:Tol biopolymer transport system component